jgi:hypothetical protein
MMVLHVFPEKDTEFQEEHLRYWFGFPDMGPHYNPDDPDQVCYCGASLVRLDDNNSAVWHIYPYTRDYWNK